MADEQDRKQFVKLTRELKHIEQAAKTFEENSKIEIKQGLGNVTEKNGTYTIYLDIEPEEIDELTPGHPNFNAEKFHEQWEKAKKNMEKQATAIKLEMLERFREWLNEDSFDLASILEGIQQAVLKASEAGAKFLRYLDDNNITIEEWADRTEKAADEVTQIIEERTELENELKKPKYKGYTLDELLESDIISEQNDLLFDAINAVRDKRRLAEQLPLVTVTGKGVASVEYPLDKVNANIWKMLKDAPQNGQLSLTIGTEKRGSKKQADIIYSINFSELENAGLNTVKRLTAFDKRVYIATSALFNGSSDYMTVSQIYATMGNESRPNARDIEKIYTSLEKMRRLTITLDNFTGFNSEHSTYPNIPRYVYNGMLLPWESIDAVVNGQRADGVIHLLREPPLVEFAKKRKQITTVSRQLLESPLSKTDANLQLDDYLIERISHIKQSNGKISNKLLYSTIFEKATITTQKQRVRAKEKISKYLEHYKKCGFIKDYKEAADGVTISY